MEVDEIGFSACIEHHIAGLKVAIQETLLVICCRQVFRQQAEVGLEFQLMEIELCGLQETVFEVVQVEQHGISIKCGLRITIREIKFAEASQLDVGQLSDGATQQFLLLQRVASTSLTTATNGVIQRHRA